jgi:hypothetical protein
MDDWAIPGIGDFSALADARSSQPHDVMLEKVDKNFPLGPDGKVQW